jgi:hypothetical protein
VLPIAAAILAGGWPILSIHSHPPNTAEGGASHLLGDPREIPIRLILVRTRIRSGQALAPPDKRLRSG